MSDPRSLTAVHYSQTMTTPGPQADTRALVTAAAVPPRAVVRHAHRVLAARMLRRLTHRAPHRACA